jgi:hypothetical protein
LKNNEKRRIRIEIGLPTKHLHTNTELERSERESKGMAGQRK